ncbi:hypothetical protein [Yersinia pseudotuberculosis]|nr:hypothetical protein [Yersinia pseudotuberculosis]
MTLREDYFGYICPKSSFIVFGLIFWLCQRQQNMANLFYSAVLEGGTAPETVLPTIGQARFGGLRHWYLKSTAPTAGFPFICIYLSAA